MLKKKDKIFLAGHKGLVGSAVLKKLKHDEDIDWMDDINEEEIYDELLDDEESPSKLIH